MRVSFSSTDARCGFRAHAHLAGRGLVRKHLCRETDLGLPLLSQPCLSYRLRRHRETNKLRAEKELDKDFRAPFLMRSEGVRFTSTGIPTVARGRRDKGRCKGDCAA